MHDRVQTLPRIMNVAVPAPQHSPMLGQLPDWQMVWSLWSSTSLRTLANSGPVGSFTRNQSGLRLGRVEGTVGSSIIAVNSYQWLVIRE